MTDEFSAFGWHAHRAVRAAAVGCVEEIGRGASMSADGSAVAAMRLALNRIPMAERVVIGEGERDAAPMLYIGEEVGSGGTEIDIALDPLEGTTLCAEARPGALTVLAFARRGGLLNAPDVYMDKLVAPAAASGRVGLDRPLEENIAALSNALAKPRKDLVVAVLSRERHQPLIGQLRSLGVRVLLFGDGDIAMGLQVVRGEGVDLYLGWGGAPEGTLTAAALRCLGGYFEGRLVIRNADEEARAQRWGVTDLKRIYRGDELATGDVVFAACGVTDGALLHGVRQPKPGVFVTETLLLFSDGSQRTILETASA